MVKVENRWKSSEAPASEGLETLVYRSRLLGSDRTLVNIFGGNTSTKSEGKDHLGNPCQVLWVKGSGSDIASITSSGFAGLKQDEIEPLFQRPEMSDEEMIAYLDMTVYERGRPRQSIETLLHAFVPALHVDHTHPDAIISIACTPNGKKIMEEIFGERAAWVDYIRPGFTLSQQIGSVVRNNPKLECVVMGKHGLVTWGETSQECYFNTIRIISEAQEYLNSLAPLDSERAVIPEVTDRDGILARLLPTLRGALAKHGPVILQVDSSSEVLDFVNSAHAKELSQIGAACPDHLVHTKMVPMFVDWNPEDSDGNGEAELKTKLVSQSEEFTKAYTAYFEANKAPGQVMFAPTPRVILIPGVGMITVGADAQGAEVSNQLYHRAIVTMKNAARMGGFVSLSAKESFGVEYWPLELYKLSLKPAPKSLAGKVAFVTGAASGIGRAIARKLATEGAHVAIVDRNLEGAKQVADNIVSEFGHRRATAVHVDITSEDLVRAAMRATVIEYGGVDIVVNNAGIASSAPIEETSLETWNLNHSILSTGYFLVAREAFGLFKQQGVGGNLVFICSKNSVAAGKNAVAYSTAKAAELHMARCLAEEGGAFGIRVNSVMPDGVLSGSSIWDGTWRAERAATYGIAAEELEEFYRKRTTLKVNILPEDIAAATYFFASDASSKTTGGVLTLMGASQLPMYARRIAVDLGASSGRVAVGTLRDGRLDIEIVHRFANQAVETADGLKWDFDNLFAEILVGIKKAGGSGDIASIGVDSWAVDYGIVSETGELKSAPFSHRDRRTDGAIDNLSPDFRSKIAELTGLQFLPFNTLYQLRAEATLSEKDQILMIPDLVHYLLCGAQVMEETNASTTQMLDPGTRNWIEKLVSFAGVSESNLPKLATPGTKLGQLHEEYRAWIGLQHTEVILPATHDTASAVLASPLDESKTCAYISSGTWSLIGVELAEPVLTEAARKAGFSNEGGAFGTTRFLKNMMGLWILQECSRVWGSSDWNALIAECEPYLESAPTFDPDQPMFMTPGSDMSERVMSACGADGRGAITASILKSLARKSAELITTLENVIDKNIDQIHIVGGGSQNAALNQLIADASGRPVIAGPTEVTLMGNLLMQFFAAGDLGSDTIRSVVKRSCELTKFEPRL